MWAYTGNNDVLFTHEQVCVELAPHYFSLPQPVPASNVFLLGYM